MATVTIEGAEEFMSGLLAAVDRVQGKLHKAETVEQLREALPTEDLNGRGFMGMTPLHSHILGGRDDLCEILLRHGADPNSTWVNTTCLSMALDKKRGKIVKLLLEHGADPWLQLGDVRIRLSVE